MKKTIMAFIIGLALSAMPVLAAENLSVTVPRFKITINNVEIENEKSEYPFITYNDVTYAPMTYKLCRLMGLKTEFAATQSGRYAFYVGNCEEYSDAYISEDGTAANGEGYYTAEIPEYAVYINDTTRETDYSDMEYPIINFRGVTYIPLTWGFINDEFDWKYSFDSENGLVIDTRDSSKPELDSSSIYADTSSAGYTLYVEGDDGYAGYPSSTYGGQYKFVWAEKGHEETTFSLEKELSELNITYFAEQIDDNGLVTFINPSLKGNILTIACISGGGDGKSNENMALKIDMSQGKIISAEKAVFLPDNSKRYSYSFAQDEILRSDFCVIPTTGTTSIIVEIVGDTQQEHELTFKLVNASSLEEVNSTDFIIDDGSVELFIPYYDAGIKSSEMYYIVLEAKGKTEASGQVYVHGAQ